MATSKEAMEQFEDESDAFFSELLQSAGGSSGIKSPATASPAAAAAESSPGFGGGTGKFAPAARTKVQSGDIESEYDALQPSMGTASSSQKPLAASPVSGVPKLVDAGSSKGVATFDLAESDEALEAPHENYAFHHAQEDYTPPAVPEPPSDFSNEDRQLHKELVDFYFGFNQDNIANVNKIVAKYRGRGVSNLWAMLALKYNIPPHQAVDLLARTLYLGSGFEHSDQEHAQLVEEVLRDFQAGGLSDRAGLFQRAIDYGAKSGSNAPLRMLAFRGIPDRPALRAQVWKVLLGYLPLDKQPEWSTIQVDKWTLYTGYRDEFLVVNENEVTARSGTASAAEVTLRRELLQEIKNDVDRTRRDFEWFRRPATCCSLLSILFVYARLNPGVGYAQGMNELAAIILYVLSVDGDLAEADSFWCFSALMADMKEGFIQMQSTPQEGVQSMVGGTARLMQTYDYELAQHLHRLELPPFVFVFRWCTLLFAQDAKLPDVVRLWDSFIADPDRYEFCMHMCLAIILANREELLRAEKQFTLAEVLQSAPARCDFEVQIRRAWAICAFERRPQSPPFPVKSTLQVMDDLGEWAQNAAKKAQVMGLQFSSHFQENIAPVVMERASKASAAAAVAAADGAQALQGWLEETAPARKEALEQAQSRMSAWWGTVRATSAVALQKGQQLAAEIGNSEAAQNAQAKFSQAAGSAGSSAGEIWSKAAAALSKPEGVGEAASVNYSPKAQADPQPSDASSSSTSDL